MRTLYSVMDCQRISRRDDFDSDDSRELLQTSENVQSDCDRRVSRQARFRCCVLSLLTLIASCACIAARSRVELPRQSAKGVLLDISLRSKRHHISLQAAKSAAAPEWQDHQQPVRVEMETLQRHHQQQGRPIHQQTARVEMDERQKHHQQGQPIPLQNSNPAAQELCERPLPDDPCYISVQWVLNNTPRQDQLSNQSLRPSSKAFQETQATLFAKGLGGCLHRPCTSSADMENNQVSLLQKCETAEWPSVCYDRVMWVLHQGLTAHPYWYSNLSKFSEHKEVQRELIRLGRKSCREPCPSVLDPSVQLSPPEPFAFSAEAAQDSDDEIFSEDPGSTQGEYAVFNFCAPHVPIPNVPNLSAPVWNFTSDEDWLCYNALLGAGQVLGPYNKLRSWCWVGVKQFGCHKHWPDRLSWQQMAAEAARNNMAIPQGFSPLTNPQLCDQRVLGGLTDWSSQELTQAKDWFAKNVAVFVLSLPSSYERRAAVQQCMRQAYLDFQFVDGVDIRQPGGFEKAREEGLIPPSFDFNWAQAEAYKQGMGAYGSISGTLGCASGHFRAQLQGNKSRVPRPLSLIFEDDICPSQDIIPRLWRLVKQELPCDWQVLSLRSMCPYGACISPHLTQVHPDMNEPLARCHHGVNYGFYGMLYRMDEIETVQEVMKEHVFNEKTPHCLDVDVALAAISDKVRYYAVPSSHDPGFLRELPEGSTRVQINFQKR